MAEDILELSALPPKRPKALLKTEADPEGTVYELAVAQDFDPSALRRLGRLVEEMDGLWMQKKAHTAKQTTRIETLLDKLAMSLIREAPAEAVAALPAVTKRALAIRFLVTTGQEMVGFAADVEEAIAP